MKVRIQDLLLIVVVDLALIQNRVSHCEVENIGLLAGGRLRRRDVAVPSFVDVDVGYWMIDGDAVQIPLAMQHGDDLDVHAYVVHLKHGTVGAGVFSLDGDSVQVKSQVRGMEIEALDINPGSKFRPKQSLYFQKSEAVES